MTNGVGASTHSMIDAGTTGMYVCGNWRNLSRTYIKEAYLAHTTQTQTYAAHL